MRRALAISIIVGLLLGAALSVTLAATGTSVPTLDEFNALEALVGEHEARLDALEAPAPTGTTGPTGTTSPPTTTAPPTGPTGPTGGGEIPPTANLQPQVTPAESASRSFYNVGVLNFDLSPGGLLHRFRFLPAEGWEFFDRWHYTCVTTYLQSPSGARVAQVTFRTADDIPGDPSVAYAGLNDAHGNEQGAGLSRCALPTNGVPLTEFEDKPAGPQDSVVQFVVNGVLQTTLVCPATGSHDAETWCEFEESASTPNHVEIEVYWRRDLIVVIDIDRMSPNVQIITS